MSMSISLEDRTVIFTSLQTRNKIERETYKDIILLYAGLHEKVQGLVTRNNDLTIENSRLREENIQLSVRAEKSGSAKNYNFEQKIFALQEEVTDLHRQKGKLAQQVIDLNKTNQDKDKVILSKNQRIAELESTLIEQQNTSRQCLDKIRELESTNQTLKDELCANHLALLSVEEKHRKLNDDYSSLLRQFLQQKDRLADKLNEEYDAFYKMKQDTIRKDLIEAANTYVNVEEKGMPMYPITFSVAIPSKVEATVDAHEGEVNCVKWSRNGKMFASGGSDRRLRLWTILNGKCEVKSTLIGSNAGITAIDFDLEESFVLGSSNDFACRIWGLSDSRLRHTLTGHTNKVVAAKFMDESNKVVTGSGDRTLKLWDLRSRACVKTMLAMSACNDVVVCSPMRLIISGHFDKKLRLWDHRGEANTDQIVLPGRITGLDISQDMTYVLACARDETLRTIDLRMNQVVQCFQADNFKTGTDCVRPTFSPDGQYVCSGSTDGGVYIWNTRTSALEKVLKEHSSVVVCCDWNTVKNAIVSCDRQKRVVCWSDFVA